MWISDQWQDFELIDCGGGEKLERWGDQILAAQKSPLAHAECALQPQPDRRRPLGQKHRPRLVGHSL